MFVITPFIALRLSISPILHEPDDDIIISQNAFEYYVKWLAIPEIASHLPNA